MFRVVIQGKIVVRTWVIGLCLLSLLADVWAQTPVEREGLEQELRVIETLLAETAQRKDRTASELAMIDRQIDLRERLLASLALEIREHETEIGRIDDQICVIEESIDGIQDNYAEAVRAVHRVKQEELFLSVLSSGSLSEAFFRIRFYRQLTKYREVQLENLRRTQLSLKEKQETLTETLARKETLREVRHQEAQNLRKTINRREKVSVEVLRRPRQTDGNNRKFLQETVQQAVSSPNIDPPALADSEIMASLDFGSSFEKDRSRLPWPVSQSSAVVISEYGSQEDAFGNQIKNNGITLRTSLGEPVHAVHSGVVTGMQTIPNGAYVVILAHGKYRTVYVGLSDIDVRRIKQGQTVSSGQELGIVFTDSRTGESSLEFMIYKEPNTFLNPMNWLSR